MRVSSGNIVGRCAFLVLSSDRRVLQLVEIERRFLLILFLNLGLNTGMEKDVKKKIEMSERLEPYFPFFE